MHIQSNTRYLPPQLSTNQPAPKMVTGTRLGLPEHDTVDLRSHKARELPADAIEHHSVHFFFSTEINELLDTLHLLAGVAKTRKVDPATGSVSYVELPQKPHGAPNDYVNPSKLMERYDPEAYKKMQAATTNQTEKVSMLIQFVKKLQHRPDWISQYRNEQATLLSDLKNTKIDNRFENVNTKDATEFVRQMNTLADNASFSTFTPMLQTNLASFMKILTRKTN